MYAASRWLRIGYRIPLISSLTTRDSIGSEVQRLDLLQHVVDARTNLVALGAQGRQLDPGGLGLGGADLGRVELGAKPGVLFRRACLFGAGTGELLGDAGLLGACPPELFADPRALATSTVEYRDELFQLLFQPVDGVQFDRWSCDRCLCHELSPHRLTAPCVSARAPTMPTIAASISPSVSVRSGQRNVKRSERLTRSSGTPLPL